MAVPTEQVAGLVEAPEKGKFYLRKAENPEANVDGTLSSATVVAPYELVLKVTGEDNYVVPLQNLEDDTIQSMSYVLLKVRRAELRVKLVEENKEVQVIS